MAFILGLVTIGGSLWLVQQGYEIGGLVGVLAALGTLLAAFLSGKRSQQRELAEKDEEI